VARLLGEGLGGRVLAFDRAAGAGGFWECGVPVLDPWRA
jgi:hypothetical protein